jgi:hypothetical protein
MCGWIDEDWARDRIGWVWYIFAMLDLDLDFLTCICMFARRSGNDVCQGRAGIFQDCKYQLQKAGIRESMAWVRIIAHMCCTEG